MTSIALFESFNNIMQQGIRALYSRRLPLAHLSRVKQEQAMIGVEHYLSELFSSPPSPPQSSPTPSEPSAPGLSESMQLQFQEELTIFRVASRESSDLQVMPSFLAQSISRQPT